MSQNQSPVFITGRFRSGSTLFWSIYNRLPGYAAYYEPLHDNLNAHIRHTLPMASHRGVVSYWHEYLPILADIKPLHHPEFGFRRLVLEPDDQYPELKDYIAFLIENAFPRRPVLQFNRVDYRLPWLLNEFPDATVVHILRDPRESWISSRRHLPVSQWADPYEPDAYDLLMWMAALEDDFPFLIDPEPRSSYQPFYYLWQLSKIIGERLCHVAIEYDQTFVDAPENTFNLLVQAGCLLPDEVQEATESVDKIEQLPLYDHFDGTFYSRTENHCNACLDASGLLSWFGKKSLGQIKTDHPDFWGMYKNKRNAKGIELMLKAFSLQRSENIRLLQEVRHNT